MKRFACLCLAMLGLPATLLAATPTDAELPEDKITMIECDYVFKRSDQALLFPGWSPARSLKEGVYHYRLYVPRGYHADEEARYPVLFIASPGGNADMKNVDERMRRDRWIVVMLVESRNATPLWLPSFLSAHDDVVKRMRVIGDMKLTTGMSGGARCASSHPAFRRGIRGVILQSAGFSYGKSGYNHQSAKRNRRLMIYGLFGYTDMNFSEVERLQLGLPSNTKVRMEVFDGGHEWAPVECRERAFDWLERRSFGAAGRGGAKVSKEACAWYWKALLARLDSGNTDFERYELMETLAALAKKPGLSGKAVRERVGGFRKELTKLKRNKAVKKELFARKNYELADRNDTREKRKSRKLAQVASFYTQIAGKFADTVYGARAAARAKSIAMERSREKK